MPIHPSMTFGGWNPYQTATPDYVSPPLVLPPPALSAYNPINPYYDMMNFSPSPYSPFPGPAGPMPGMMPPPIMPHGGAEGYGHHGILHEEHHGEGERYSMTAFWQRHPLLQYITMAFAVVGAWKLGLNRLVKDGAHRISDRTR